LGLATKRSPTLRKLLQAQFCLKDSLACRLSNQTGDGARFMD
jgi:hypothetical protein